MRVLVVNAGSSSLKLTVLGPGDEVEADHEVERWHGADDLDPLRRFLDGLGSAARPDAVGHRVVHGGPDRTGPARIDDAVAADLEALTDLAPLHQPRALAGIDAAGRLLPTVPQVACFDTAFHTTLPPAAATYALPAAWRSRWPVRRYGFHGLSHAWAARHGPAVAGFEHPPARILTCHLGSGASLCAVRDGRSVDTTMGFSPLEGLVMATRSGSVDPGLVLWLQTRGGLSADEVSDGLERHGGLAGLSGTGGDLRDVLAARDAGDDHATLAVDVYLHRLAREAGAMVASLGGLDLVVLTGGVGEHSAEVRADLADRLGHLGVAVDPAANDAAHGDADLSPVGTAGPRTVVVTAREDLEVARQVRALLTPAG